MIVAAAAVTVAWQKLLVCGLPEASTRPTVVRYGDMPLVQTSGKALNCNLIREAGAAECHVALAVAPGTAEGIGDHDPGRDPGQVAQARPQRARRAVGVLGARPAAYSVNSELTDSSLEIRVIVSARS